MPVSYGHCPFHPHLCQAALCVANYTPPCPPTFQTLVYTHTHTQKKLSRLFKCKCHHTWKVARKCRHSNGGTWQRSARIFSQCESEPCECLGLLCCPTDEKICVNVSLSDLKSLNKHFKAHFGIFEHPRQLICSWIIILNAAHLAGDFLSDPNLFKSPPNQQDFKNWLFSF